jgi:2-polyprenyl-6-methoxyphenol hydroxylase-like FAD-dependent oxidoreductase
MDADVIIVGAGPTGLMLAGELRLAGVRPLVLERQPQPRDTPKAGGLSGQILQLLRYRGELGRFEAASTAPRPAPRFPWGGMHVDFTQLADPPMQALALPQPRLERVLGSALGRTDPADALHLSRGHDYHALIGTFAPDLALHTDRSAASVAELITPHGPSSSTSRTAQTSARPPETGSIASTSTPPKPIADQPTPS